MSVSSPIAHPDPVTPVTPVSPRRAAVAAGVGLAVMALISPVAVFALIPAEQELAAAALLLVVAALDVLVGICLVPVLRPGGRGLAMIAAGLRIAYAAVLALAAVRLAGTADAALFKQIWDLGLLFFGAHLLLVGVLAWRAASIPRWLGVLVMIAGLGYLIDSLVVLFILAVPVEVSTVSFIGEVALLLWLLIRGGRR